MSRNGYSKPRNDIYKHDRVLYTGKGKHLFGRVSDCRYMPHPFGGPEVLWARIVWDNPMCESSWIEVNNALQVVPDAVPPVPVASGYGRRY